MPKIKWQNYIDKILEISESLSDRSAFKIFNLLATSLIITLILSSLLVEYRDDLSEFNVGNVSPITFHSHQDLVIEVDNIEAKKSLTSDPQMLSEKMYYQVDKGDLIIRAGEIISPIQSLKIKSLINNLDSSHFFSSLIGYFLILTLSLGALYAFTKSTFPNFRLNDRDLLILSLVLIGTASIIKIFSLLATFVNLGSETIYSSSFMLAAPFAMGGILLQVIFGSASVVFFTLSISLIYSVFVRESLPILTIIIIGNIIGSLKIRNCPRRSAFLEAGAWVAASNLLITFLFIIINPDFDMKGFNATFSESENIYKLIFAIFGGFSAGLISTGVTPIIEFIGGYITDIKLLELASLDRPILNQLAEDAPGTWNHSMVIGQLSEVAATAIGANGLLARVGAYYHDIGKMKKAQYFVENQTSKENKHDKLAPSMSALIIKAHVKDGMDIAEEIRLPKAISDFIPQHHGTSLISYFYDKALKEAEDGELVDEAVYRYGGPKPQTKEAGILMLADTIEASSRTITDPSPAKIQGLVQKVINKIFASGELNESNLTLRDLNIIAKSFTRVLTGIYHKRISYSAPAEKVRNEHDNKNSTSDAGKKVVKQNVDKNIEKVHEKREDKKSTAEAKNDHSEKSQDSHKLSEGDQGKTDEGGERKGAENSNKDALKRLGIN